MNRIYGIGIDIVKNSRIQHLLSKNQNYTDRFITKVLNPQEIKTFRLKQDIQSQTLFLSSRWAYKEAMVKASGDKSLIYPDMNLIKNQAGKPFVELLNGNRTKIYDDLKIQNIHLSISHDDDNSIAFVILEY